MGSADPLRLSARYRYFTATSGIPRTEAVGHPALSRSAERRALAERTTWAFRQPGDHGGGSDRTDHGHKAGAYLTNLKIYWDQVRPTPGASRPDRDVPLGGSLGFRGTRAGRGDPDDIR
jgi:hypothetical protein